MGNDNEFDNEEYSEFMKAVLNAVQARVNGVNKYVDLYAEMKQMEDAGFSHDEAFTLLVTFIESAAVM